MVKTGRTAARSWPTMAESFVITAGLWGVALRWKFVFKWYQKQCKILSKVFWL